MKNAAEVLNKLKGANENIDWVIVNENGEVFARRGTMNFYSIYSLEGENGERIYGVYEKDFQIDSRTHSDEEISEVISKMMNLGKLVDRETLDFKGYKFEWE